MSRTALLALVPAILTAAALPAACGGDDPAPVADPATPREYIAAADLALRGPSRMVRLVGRQTADLAAPAPERRRVDEIVDQADRAGARLAELEIADPELDRQRDALVERQRAIVGAMRRIADPLARGDREALRVQAPSLYALMRRLPSDVAAASPRS